MLRLDHFRPKERLVGSDLLQAIQLAAFPSLLSGIKRGIYCGNRELSRFEHTSSVRIVVSSIVSENCAYGCSRQSSISVLFHVSNFQALSSNKIFHSCFENPFFSLLKLSSLSFYLACPLSCRGWIFSYYSTFLSKLSGV